jgi:hypothetical protein
MTSPTTNQEHTMETMTHEYRFVYELELGDLVWTDALGAWARVVAIRPGANGRRSIELTTFPYEVSAFVMFYGSDQVSVAV